MSGLELNKIVAAILLASLITMLVGFVANILYKPNLKPDKRGYSVQVTTDSEPAETVSEVKVDIEALMKTANVETGKELSKKCITCHTFEKNGKAKVGPNLWNMVGFTKAATPGYTFSAALKSLTGVWDIESLYHFINKPNRFAPGTKMTFIGLSKPEDVVNIIAYLQTLTDN